MSQWSRETIDPAARRWEEFYRNRFQHDKRVRTTHGVNCTGSCSWEVFVKDGIVTWELQATDYPSSKRVCRRMSRVVASAVSRTPGTSTRRSA